MASISCIGNFDILKSLMHLKHASIPAGCEQKFLWKAKMRSGDKERDKWVKRERKVDLQ